MGYFFFFFELFFGVFHLLLKSGAFAALRQKVEKWVEFFTFAPNTGLGIVRFSPCRQCLFYFQKKGVFEMDFWSYLGSSVAGGGIGSLLVGWWLKRREKEHDELKRLEKERIDQIATDLEAHLKESNPRETNSKIDQLRGEVYRLRDSVDRDRERRAAADAELAKVLGELSGAISGIKKWLDNINASVQNHITSQDIHHHGKQE